MKLLLLSLALLFLLLDGANCFTLKFWEYFQSAPPPPPTSLDILKSYDRTLWANRLNDCNSYLSNASLKVNNIGGNLKSLGLNGAQLLTVIRAILDFNDNHVDTPVNFTTFFPLTAANNTNNTTSDNSTNTINNTTAARLLQGKMVSIENNENKPSIFERVAHGMYMLYQTFDYYFPSKARSAVSESNHVSLSESLSQMEKILGGYNMDMTHQAQVGYAPQHLSTNETNTIVSKWAEYFSNSGIAVNKVSTLAAKVADVVAEGQNLINVLKPIPPPASR